MKFTWILAGLSIMLFASCTETAKPEHDLDFSSPEMAVHALLDAAEKGDYNMLHRLCSPLSSELSQGGACFQLPGTKTEEESVKRLAHAHMEGNIRIDGTMASIDVRLNALEKQMVELSFVEGSWYIANIEHVKLNQ